MKRGNIRVLRFAAAATVLGVFLASTTVLVVSANDVEQQVDGITGATIPVKKGTVSLNGETLISLLEFGGAAYLLSTVNEDGTPHMAPIEPTIDADGNIRIVSTFTKTRKNIDTRGKAMLTVYAISCGGDDAGMHLGARLLLSRVGEKVSKNKIKSYGLRSIVLHIEEELPLVEKEFKRPKAPYRR